MELQQPGGLTGPVVLQLACLSNHCFTQSSLQRGDASQRTSWLPSAVKRPSLIAQTLSAT